MFDKLFEIFNKVSAEQPRVIEEREPIVAPLSVSEGPQSRGTMIGFDYMKRPLDEEKDDIKPRAFPRLAEFLRGRYK